MELDTHIMIKSKTQRLTLSGLFLALGIILPYVTAHGAGVPGTVLLPMHIPVLLCGFFCGPLLGAFCGLILPFLNSILTGMPVMYPHAINMAFELAAYGFVLGYLFGHAKWKCTKSLYRCLIISMIVGRIVKGIVQCILLGFGDNGFTFAAFISDAFLNALPGIILQLVLIPAIMLILGKTHLVHFNTQKCKTQNAK